ncbi:WD repeat-containing protein 70-like [Limulus polyphemus]|uniref:WD repeat-containing protein 70-like n=1 Tax=Limulus polyphemus TaxID=6850 RepID=A0ABM1BND2_LIMPO|nr:WD repeat-containing protein 70-like [Limulus polyphemus]
MEDDLEEMRALRESQDSRQFRDNRQVLSKGKVNYGGTTEEFSRNLSNKEDSDDMSKLVGFSGFGKKARTFDFEAMFEQTRRAAIERNQKNEELKIENLVSQDAQKDNNKQVARLSTSQSKEDNDTSSDDDIIGPPIPPEIKARLEEEGDGESEEEDDGEEMNRYKKIPDSHEVELRHGDKSVTALGLDPSGARLVTGSSDFDIQFWDFAGMGASLQSFRTLRPCECHQIKNLEYTVTGDAILVVSGGCQAKVLDRDGFEIFECAKGDQYITDMARTKGHIAMLNDGCWHPREKEFLTCSNDGTLRLWEVEKQLHVIKPKKQGGLRAIPTACRYSRDGILVAGACQDGSVQMWDHRKHFVNTAVLIRNAHQNGTETSSLAFSYNGKHFATRGGDDTLKLWDIRNYKHPLNSADNLFNRYPVTDCMFSPDDKLLFTGVSLTKGDTTGKLVFLDCDTFHQMYEIEVSDAGIIRSLWHPKLNEIIVGCSNGLVKVYYNPDLSERGAKLCVVKTQRKKKQVEVIVQQHIITPHALPMFRQDRPRSTKKQLEKDRKDPMISKQPELPITGPGQGGRIASAGNTLSSYIVRNLGIKKKEDDNIDPREAILRHAKEAAENPYWISPAYSKTQPKPVFQEVEEEEEPTLKKTKFSV